MEAAGTDAPQAALPTFTLTAYTGSMMRVQGFDLPVVVDLAGIDIPSQHIPVRLDHKSQQGVGHTIRIEAGAGQLTAEGVISRDTSFARDVLKSGLNGFPWKMSIGGPVYKTDYIAAGQKVNVNGKEFSGPLEVVRSMTLKEISFVDNAADDQTGAVIQAQESPDEPEKKLETDTKPEPEQLDAKSSEPNPMELYQQLLADQRRIATIQAIGGGKHPDLECQAITENWTVERFRTAFQNRQIPPSDRIPQQPIIRNDAMTPKTLEAIALSTSGSSVKYLESQYDEKTLEAADRYRGIGIQEFCELICAGKHLPKFRRDSRGWLEAAFSSMALPGILSNVANKTLLEGFLQMDDTWRKIVKIASVNNFQQHTRYRMNGLFKYEKVASDGELKHGKLDEQQFSQKIDTHGIMFSLTRQMIIDDDLGAFTDIPRAIGIGASEAINDAVWQCLLANANQSDGKPFFSTEHKNMFSGANCSLDIPGLTNAELRFSEQERSAGRPLGIPPKILLVPTALKVMAEMLMKSVTINESTDINKPKPAMNPHTGKYEIVSTPYLASPAFKNSSDLAWYLLADPLRLAALEVAFLSGVDRPTVERADADFNTLGIMFRGYIDFGVKEQDHRGIIKLVP